MKEIDFPNAGKLKCFCLAEILLMIYKNKVKDSDFGVPVSTLFLNALGYSVSTTDYSDRVERSIAKTIENPSYINLDFSCVDNASIQETYRYFRYNFAKLGMFKDSILKVNRFNVYAEGDCSTIAFDFAHVADRNDICIVEHDEADYSIYVEHEGKIVPALYSPLHRMIYFVGDDKSIVQQLDFEKTRILWSN